MHVSDVNIVQDMDNPNEFATMVSIAKIMMTEPQMAMIACTGRPQHQRERTKKRTRKMKRRSMKGCFYRYRRSFTCGYT